MAYEESGAPDGFPVFLMHGTPGSRRGPKPRGIVLYRMGRPLVAYDRPGYGGSAGRAGPGRGLGARADLRIADELGIDRFAVWATPAAARTRWPARRCCAGRVSRAAVARSASHRRRPMGLDWFDGMNRDNQPPCLRRRSATTTEIVVERDPAAGRPGGGKRPPVPAAGD